MTCHYRQSCCVTLKDIVVFIIFVILLLYAREIVLNHVVHAYQQNNGLNEQMTITWKVYEDI